MYTSRKFRIPASMSAEEAAKCMYVYLAGAYALEPVWDGDPQKFRSHGPRRRSTDIWDLNSKGDVRLIISADEGYLETTNSQNNLRLDAMVALFIVSHDDVAFA